MKYFDRDQTHMYPLSQRIHALTADNIAMIPGSSSDNINEYEAEQIRNLASKIKTAKQKGKSIMLTYGAHLIKNGAAPIIIQLIKEGWLSHVATNGAGSIHDWEFAYIGKSTESVRDNVATGTFGTWDETGTDINLAVAAGAAEGLGYGEAIGKMIAEDGIMIPSEEELINKINSGVSGNNMDNAAAAMDLLKTVRKYRIKSGFMKITHRRKDFSVQYACYKHNIPFTVHPGIGYDIIYTHPINDCASIGRAAQRDFLSFAHSVTGLDGGGVSISVGSAVMSPMVFEKSMSMSNNLAITHNGTKASDFYLAIVDIQDGGGWDWTQGEPPMDNPAYYLRFCKSFYRMGGKLDYICLDNRLFISNLYKELSK